MYIPQQKEPLMGSFCLDTYLLTTERDAPDARRVRKIGRAVLMFLTGTVQVVALFTKELATSCESLPDFLTVSSIFRNPTKQMVWF